MSSDCKGRRADLSVLKNYHYYSTNPLYSSTSNKTHKKFLRITPWLTERPKRPPRLQSLLRLQGTPRIPRIPRTSRPHPLGRRSRERPGRQIGVLVSTWTPLLHRSIYCRAYNNGFLVIDCDHNCNTSTVACGKCKDRHMNQSAWCVGG